MNEELFELWIYLSTQPLLGLTITLGAYVIGDTVYRACGLSPWANPVLIAIILVVVLLIVTETEYRLYFEGAQFVHFLLGPATVALAIPLYRNLARLRRSWRALSIALFAGSVTAVGTAVAVGWLGGVGPEILASLAPKSVTTPIAMGVAERLGGLPSLTAVLVILTGILGAVIGPTLMSRIGVKDMAARGFALGLSAHGIGTARALTVSDVAGAFASLAIGLNGIATAGLLALIAVFL